VAALNLKLIVRIPLIPGFNMDGRSLGKTLEFLKRLDHPEVNILPFHQLGSQKYVYFGKDYKLKDLKAPQDEEVEDIRQLFEKSGINVTIGG
jgi:pyruvate formate lyase activating enzyme